MGYDPIIFERGHIPWDKEDPHEFSCYREIHTCDILVTVIGEKFGTQSRNNEPSITQNEINEAFDRGKQVYLFVDKSVYAEYYTYQKISILRGLSQFLWTIIKYLTLFMMSTVWMWVILLSHLKLLRILQDT
ncbi:DUF4062 domain-containing protein [Erwinia psidii]|uniref:DUF4062 domain-containing protein n=1 Tax=Erwinia psidii TaxID=69224 RepID=A0A3N6SDY9_9GAMM|nr:DUF4062 domain-containing protein [Erwinia psidii]MCX8966906.1 DUF4062 domain-containing protein [Erwinia psidii]RQM38103.1 DUF4062 domain-containing protein [Erwinia psidii]